MSRVQYPTSRIQRHVFAPICKIMLANIKLTKGKLNNYHKFLSGCYVHVLVILLSSLTLISGVRLHHPPSGNYFSKENQSDAQF